MNADKTIVLMLGLPGSGKSTYVNRVFVPQGYQVICQDDIHLAFGHRYHGPLEPFIHNLAAMQARQLMIRGLNIVIDESTAKAHHVHIWQRLADEMGYTLKAVCITAPIALCKERRAATNFPLEVIDYKNDFLVKEWPAIMELVGERNVEIKEAECLLTEN